jgi:hypothetical protein
MPARSVISANVDALHPGRRRERRQVGGRDGLAAVDGAGTLPPRDGGDQGIDGPAGGRQVDPDPRGRRIEGVGGPQSIGAGGQQKILRRASQADVQMVIVGIHHRSPAGGIAGKRDPRSRPREPPGLGVVAIRGERREPHQFGRRIGRAQVQGPAQGRARRGDPVTPAGAGRQRRRGDADQPEGGGAAADPVRRWDQRRSRADHCCGSAVSSSAAVTSSVCPKPFL